MRGPILRFIFLITVLTVLETLGQPINSWVKGFGGRSIDLTKSVSIDNNSNVYAFGIFSDTIDLDHGPGINNLIAKGKQDLFLQKTDASGNFINGFSIKCDTERCGKIVSDKNGQWVIMTGSFLGQADFDPGPGISVLNSNNGTNFILKISAQGQLIWVKQFGNSDFNSCELTALSRDDSENVIISGIYNDTLKFNVLSFLPYIAPVDLQNIFIAKFNSSGNLIWVNYFGSKDSLKINDISTDEKDNIYSVGFYSDSLKISTKTNEELLISVEYSNDILVCKFNSAGDLMWSKSFGGEKNDEGLAIDVDKCDNIYFCGNFQDSLVLESENQNYTIIADSLKDALLIKLKPSGQILWAKVMNGTGNESAESIKVNLNGDVFACGVFDDSLGSSINNPKILSFGQTDIFIVKFDALGNEICLGQIGGQGYEFSCNMQINERDEIFLGGYYENNCDFDPGPGNILFTSNGSKDAFINKLLPGTCCVESQPPTLALANPKEFCFGESSTLIAIPETPGTCPNFAWYHLSCGLNFQSNEDTISVSPQYSSSYFVRTEGPCDTSICRVVDLTINPKPLAYFEYILTMNCVGPQLKFENKSILSDSYQWQFSDGSLSIAKNPIDKQFPYNEEIKIILIAKNIFGCGDTFTLSTKFTNIEDYYQLIIPNIFTPNNDGINDIFEINFKGDFRECFKISIIDRWGIEIFFSENPQFNWDGKNKSGQKIPEGVYFYILEIAEKKHRGYITITQ